jgi:hypothetical protein
MKKTMHSLLTAAMFTAAATSSFHASAAEAALMQKTERTDQLLYGPAPVTLALGDMNWDREVDARDLTVLKQKILANDGVIQRSARCDPDGDGWAVIFGASGFSLLDLGDLNQDMKLDKEDVDLMIRMLTGKPEKEDEIKENSETITTTVTTETAWTRKTLPTTTWDWDVVVPLYGPPPAA